MEQSSKQFIVLIVIVLSCGDVAKNTRQALAKSNINVFTINTFIRDLTTKRSPTPLTSTAGVFTIPSQEICRENSSPERTLKRQQQRRLKVRLLNAVRTWRNLDFSSDNENNSAPVDYDVQEIIVHPQYDPESRVRYNDIAMIKTVEKITYNEFVFPYCLVRERPKPKTLVTGAGFGLINATHQSPILQEAELKVVGTAECENIYKNEDYEPQLRLLYPNLLESQDIICASFPNRSACQGDSGGPLFLDDDEGRRFLVGIVGAGVSCRGSGVSRLPGLFISIADHIPFINSVLFEDLGTE
nr:venom peptide isomerase heavy chain-like [Cherax quadricarinatus]